VKRSKRPPRGNGNRLGPQVPCYQHPSFSPFGTYYWCGRECRITKYHPPKGSVRSGDGLRTQWPIPERFTILLVGDSKKRTVACRDVWKQPHPPRRKWPFTKRGGERA
jgi:hypothetical protein